jgi:hypothetical protein
MDCFVAFAPLRKRFAFVAGNDVAGFGFNLAQPSLVVARLDRAIQYSRDVSA